VLTSGRLIPVPPVLRGCLHLLVAALLVLAAARAVADNAQDGLRVVVIAAVVAAV